MFFVFFGVKFNKIKKAEGVEKSMNLEIYAKQIIEEFVLEHNSFSSAKKCMHIGDYVYEYDAMTLLIYDHNLPDDICKHLFDEIRKKYQELNLNRNKVKKYNETKVLFNFVIKFPLYFDWSICKGERPDFVLSKNGKKVGIEITEITFAIDKIIEELVNLNRGKNFSAEEIIANLPRNRQKYREDLEFYDNAIGTKLLNFDERREVIIKNLNEKLKKYPQEQSEYDDFFLVCDGYSSYDNSSKYDAELILNRLEYPENNKMKVIILYQDEGELKWVSS